MTCVYNDVCKYMLYLDAIQTGLVRTKHMLSVVENDTLSSSPSALASGLHPGIVARQGCPGTSLLLGVSHIHIICWLVQIKFLNLWASCTITDARLAIKLRKSSHCCLEPAVQLPGILMLQVPFMVGAVLQRTAFKRQ